MARNSVGSTPRKGRWTRCPPPTPTACRPRRRVGLPLARSPAAGTAAFLRMIGLVLGAKTPRDEYPRPMLRRRDWVNLNGEWEFGAGDERVFDRTITVPFCPQSELSGVGQTDLGDVVWYRRTFDAPPAERLLLHLGAVDYRATVWVNGEEVAAHEGGHTPFTADISRVARDGGNEIVVRAEDPLADRAGREVDHVSSHFGLRTLEARDGKFLLNGEPYFQRLILDQGYFPGGLLTAARDADLRRDIELAKSLGFNGARKHQKIEDPRWLFWADRLGFLVWEEMPSFHQHSAEAERRLATEWEQAVTRDRGHACIVAWVPMNESFGLQSVKPDVAARFLDGLYHFTHDIDGTRPVISNDGWEHTHTDICTLHDYNPGHALKRRYGRLYTALDAAAHPKPLFLPGYEYRGEPLLVTEFGGIAMANSGGFGWSEAGSVDEFVATYREMVEALTQPGPVEGFGYTQLTDVEQERNGLLNFDREPKADIGVLREITELPKR